MKYSAKNMPGPGDLWSGEPDGDEEREAAEERFVDEFLTESTKDIDAFTEVALNEEILFQDEVFEALYKLVAAVSQAEQVEAMQRFTKAFDSKLEELARKQFEQKIARGDC